MAVGNVDRSWESSASTARSSLTSPKLSRKFRGAGLLSLKCMPPTGGSPGGGCSKCCSSSNSELSVGKRTRGAGGGRASLPG